MRAWKWRSTPRFTAAVGVSIALALTTLTACGGDSDGGPEANGKYAGTVEWWTNNLSKGFTPYIQGMIDDYESKHPDVTIKWVDVAPTDMSSKYLATVASGAVPDAVNFSSAEIGTFGPTLADMSDYFSSDDLAIYQPGLLNSLIVDGKQYGVPWYNGGGLISYYRKSVMDKVGFSADNPPATFDDTLALAQKVKDETGVFGMNISFLFTLPYYYGIPVLNEDKTAAAFNTPEMAAVLEKLKAAYDDGALAPGTIAKDWHNYPQTVANEQIAFMPANWATDLGGLADNAPEVFKDLEVAEGPADPDGNQLLNGQQTFAIPAKSDNKAAAAEWLKFVTDAENQLEFCKQVAIYPSTVATVQDPFFTKTTGDTATDAARALVVASMSKLTDVGSYGTTHDIELQDLFAEQVRAALSGSKSVQDALDTAESEWNDLLGS